MSFCYCWHRPGPTYRNVRTCRHCRVAIEECPCVSFGRNCAPGCTCCEGSGWVGIVRSKAATVAQMVDLGGMASNGLEMKYA